MSALKNLLKHSLPHGIIEQRRRRFRLGRLGLVPKTSNAVSIEEAVHGCHFDLWPAFLRKAKDWTLVDVGANEGDFIRAAAKLAEPGQVIAFEPLPSCQDILSPLLAGIRGGKLVRAAVGAAAGELELNCTGNTKMSSLLPPQPGIEASYANGDYAVVQKLKVPIVRLDDVIEPNTHIGLLKLDVQGFEMEALRGAERTLRQTQCLLVEVNYTAHYQGAVTFDSLHAFLNTAGFHLHGISAPYCDESRPLWADAMYVRDGQSGGVK